MIRVELPAHLRKLANCGTEVTVEVDGLVSQKSVLDAIERAFPMLRGTIRDYGTNKRRPFLRFFADSEDVSLNSPTDLLPQSVTDGTEPFMIVGAIAGG